MIGLVDDGVVVIVIAGFVRARVGLFSNMFLVASIYGVSQGLHGFKGARFTLSTHDVLDSLSQPEVITMSENRVVPSSLCSQPCKFYVVP